MGFLLWEKGSGKQDGFEGGGGVELFFQVL